MSQRIRAPWIRPAVSGVLVAGFACAAALVWAGGARATSDLVVSPSVVAPGGKVVVEGSCPEPVVGDYERATVGVDALGRYVVVDVEADGGFRATFRAHGVGEVEEPEAGDAIRAQVSCATASSYVASVGTVQVDVVTTEEADAARAAATPDVTPASVGSAQAGGASASDEPISPWIPISALVVAVVGTIGAFTVSRRGDRRAAAMTGHPAQRGMGRPDRRDAK